MGLTAKEYLEQIKKIDTLIKNTKNEIRNYEQQTLDVALSITPGGETIRKTNKKTGEVEWDDVYGVEKVKSSSSGNSFANAVINNVDSVSKLEKKIKALESCREEIIKSIESLPEPEYDVLYMVYAQYLTYAEVSIKRKCSKSTVERLHEKGLKSLELKKGGKFPRYVEN